MDLFAFWNSLNICSNIHFCTLRGLFFIKTVYELFDNPSCWYARFGILSFLKIPLQGNFKFIFISVISRTRLHPIVRGGGGLTSYRFFLQLRDSVDSFVLTKVGFYAHIYSMYCNWNRRLGIKAPSLHRDKVSMKLNANWLLKFICLSYIVELNTSRLNYGFLLVLVAIIFVIGILAWITTCWKWVWCNLISATIDGSEINITAYNNIREI